MRSSGILGNERKHQAIGRVHANGKSDPGTQATPSTARRNCRLPNTARPVRYKSSHSSEPRAWIQGPLHALKSTMLSASRIEDPGSDFTIITRRDDDFVVVVALTLVGPLGPTDVVNLKDVVRIFVLGDDMPLREADVAIMHR